MNIPTYWTQPLISSLFPPLRVGATDQGVCQVSFSIQEFSRLEQSPAAKFARQAICELEEYFSKERTDFDVPIDWNGMTPFQCRVLTECSRIPYGQVVTYTLLAGKLNTPGGVRAVATALARNPLPILIPCHRVIGSDFKLHGYSAPGGVQVKARLLELEGALMPITQNAADVQE